MSEYFPEIRNVEFEGVQSNNPAAFRYYNPKEVIAGKTMEEHFRFSMAYWHTLTGEGNDPFGVGTAIRPWHKYSDPMDIAKVRLETGFEFMRKIGMPYFCFHDRDIAPEGKTLSESNKNLDVITEMMEGLMQETGISLLWGTANLFSNPRYMHGAATSCSADVFAYAAAQVKKAMEITKRLGGQNYVFWGGREGYETLLNTDMGLEQDNLARFLGMAVDFAREIGFTGQFLIEPKPMEPTKHQYDFDGANVLAFLRKYELLEFYKLNLETNHATLAGHAFQHELRYARENGVLGSVDANQGDMLLGWDTDQFPTNLYVTIFAMYEVLMNGGLKTGGFNFDAKVRRGSHEMVDLFYSHIAGMDTFARGLKIANALIEDGSIERFIKERYASYSSGIGADILSGDAGFKELEAHAMQLESITLPSGRQEMLENLINRFI